MDDLDALLRRFSQGYLGEDIARENFECDEGLLLQRLYMVDRLSESPDWNSRKYIKHHSELLAYLAMGRKLAGYPAS